MSLAIVFYFGIVEVMFMSLDQARAGHGRCDSHVDAGGGLRAWAFWRDPHCELLPRRPSGNGLHGAAESAVRWDGPLVLGCFTTAVGLGSLYTSDILPIKKFGMFTAIAVMGTVGVLFTILPVFLHRFPISDDLVERQSGRTREGHLPDW